MIVFDVGSWSASDTITGIKIRSSSGNSKTGNGHKFFVFLPDWVVSHYSPYKEWRLIIRAWSTQEAIAIANQHPKVERWSKMIWQKEFNRLIELG